MTRMLNGLTPRQIVEHLDQHIVGQDDAKRAVAIALRNRERRRALDPELQEEIYPKNIIMIGTTGVGKTEIARRLAQLVDAPFIKVEATKFTEVGYVGRDVDAIIRDLLDAAINRAREQAMTANAEIVAQRVEERLIDLLLPPSPREQSGATATGESREATRERLRQMLREGKFDDREVEIEVQQSTAMAIPLAGTGMEEMASNLQEMLDSMLPKQIRTKRVTVRQARPILEQEQLNALLDMDAIVARAKERVEQEGIVFLDEIDKIIAREGGHGPDVSREGVQRDILPIVEGSTVNTKYGPVHTDHILFIAAGAFHGSKPTDLIPELQGRFPIRVELSSLTESDLARILTEPRHSLLQQYVALLATEGVTLVFDDAAVHELARTAARVNQESEDIGARRLHTVLERVLEELSYNAPELAGQTITITPKYVSERLADILEDRDLARYIL